MADVHQQVGRRTVEMRLIFTLGRPDVLRMHNFRVRKGYRMPHRLEVQPWLDEIWAQPRANRDGWCE